MLCEFSESYEQAIEPKEVVRTPKFVAVGQKDQGLGTLVFTTGPEMREAVWSSVPTTCAV